MGNRILIVDDAAFMRMMIKDVLSKNGFDICGEAENGKIAVEKYNELQPDLVIMDITMPEVNGIESLKAIKKINGAAKVVLGQGSWLDININNGGAQGSLTYDPAVPQALNFMVPFKGTAPIAFEAQKGAG